MSNRMELRAPSIAPVPAGRLHLEYWKRYDQTMAASQGIKGGHVEMPVSNPLCSACIDGGEFFKSNGQCEDRIPVRKILKYPEPQKLRFFSPPPPVQDTKMLWK